MALHVIQTSDDRRYLPLLQASERLTRAFCARHGYAYTAFAGMKRGRAPVHAAYNRIFMLHELLMQGHRDWVLYLDADAYLQDLDFDVDAYLAKNAAEGFDFIAAEAHAKLPQIWCINNGVYFINLGSEGGQRVVLLMRHLVDSLVPAEYWDNPESTWAPEGYDDQNMLYGVLAREPSVQGRIKKESGTLFNYRGRFIGQCLRTDYPTLDGRIGFVRERVDALWQAEARRLGEAQPPLPSAAAPRLGLLMPASDVAAVQQQLAALALLPTAQRAQVELLLLGALPFGTGTVTGADGDTRDTTHAARAAADLGPLPEGLRLRHLLPTTDLASASAGAVARAAALGLAPWLLLPAPGRVLDCDGLDLLLGGLDRLDAPPLYRFRPEAAAHHTPDDAVLLTQRHLAELGGLWPLPDAPAHWQALLTALVLRVAEPAVAITNIGWQVAQPELLTHG